MKKAISVLSCALLVAACGSTEPPSPGEASAEAPAGKVDKVAACLGMVQSVKERGIKTAQVVTAQISAVLVEKGYVGLRDQAQKIANSECSHLDLTACLARMETDQSAFFKSFASHKAVADKLSVNDASQHASVACSSYSIGDI